MQPADEDVRVVTEGTTLPSPFDMLTTGEPDKAKPLDPDTWDRVLGEAKMPGRRVVVEALRRGVPLTLQDVEITPTHQPNHPSLYSDLIKVTEGIAKEVEQGRYRKVSPSYNGPINISALGVAPKHASPTDRRSYEALLRQRRLLLRRAASDDFAGQNVKKTSHQGTVGEGTKLRIIHDLTHPEGQNVNTTCEAPHFRLPTAVKFASTLKRGDYLWKSDLEAAFRQLPVRERDWPLLAFHVDGQLYVDTRLPFGHRLSPYYFCNFVGRPILYVAVSRGAHLLGALQGYVDDFFGGSDTYKKAKKQMDIWLQVCRDLGVPVSKAKTFLPSKVLKILGYIIDTEAMTIAVDSQRIAEILERLHKILHRKKVKRKELESLAGKMVFAASVIPGARVFMQSILQHMKTVNRSNHWIALNSGFRRDAEWWATFATTWNGVELITPKVRHHALTFSSDAGGEGLGLFLDGMGIHIPLSLQCETSTDALEGSLIIAETELIAAVTLISLIAPQYANQHLLVRVDNTNAISWVDRGASQRPRVMRALRWLWRVQATFRVRLSLRYISSEDNGLADSLSRRDYDRFGDLRAQWYDINGFSHRQDTRGSDAAQRTAAAADPTARCVILTPEKGPTGSTAARLVQYLVEGDDQDLFAAEGAMEQVLCDLRAQRERSQRAKFDRLPHSSVHDRKGKEGGAERRAFESIDDTGILELLGTCTQLQQPRTTESSAAPTGADVHERAGTMFGKKGEESRASDTSTTPIARGKGRTRTERPEAASRYDDCAVGLLGVLTPGQPHAKAKAEPCNRVDRHTDQGGWDRADHQKQQDKPVPGEDSPHPLAEDRGYDMSSQSDGASDDNLLIPFIPPTIECAVLDKEFHTLRFRIPGVGERDDKAARTTHRAFIQERLCEGSVRERSPSVESYASRGLEDDGGGTLVRRECSVTKSSINTLSVA